MSEFDSGKQKLILKSNAKEDYNYREAIKTLRTNIQFCGSNIRVVMLTSSLPDEGKSSISISLAESLAQIGNKTILIDADIRKSVMFTGFRGPDMRRCTVCLSI